MKVEAAVEKGPSINDKLSREKKELEKLKGEIEEKRDKNITIKKREGSVLSQLEEMDRRLRILQKEADLIELKMKEKDSEMGDLSGVIRNLNQDIQGKKVAISKRLRTIYQERQAGSLKILSAARDYPDFMRRLHYLRTIAQKEGEMLSQFKERHAELEEKGRQLGAVKEHLVKDKEALAEKLVEIRSEKRKKDQFLARVRNERTFYERSLAELDESSLQLQTIIKKLEEEKKRLQQPAGDKFSKEKGRLTWPNDGQIVSLFGRQKHPKFDTFIFKKGIEIEPSKGDQVRSVYDGVIIFANWFRGYGMVIIVDHGENYYSIYAHLAKLLVSVGDRVGKNVPIGQVGETGLSQGSNLYFEIRHQGEPLDPLAWLQRKR
ncbi:MAG: peptidoglycan DD-metalloendopeptidase family protein [Nitrospirae bacterium]|nr:peptidoglycan DD-metalloendopeptidase family protein [Candidatus Manganitrophaceae bacterium]